METLSTTSVSQAERVAATPVAAARPQAAASSAPPQNIKPTQPDYTVNISAQARTIADRSSNAQGGQQVKPVGKGPAPKAEAKTPVAQSSQAEFAVEKNNRVVMRVLEQPSGNVVRELPSSDERHIRDTVARLVENGGNLLAAESGGG